ncbi:hypothetical protein DAI21_22585 (plasmid) [Lelliottia sp. WB101]|nr:hypothetical protein DAI21_22585 [Lelliottia sp. WB101]
MFRMIRSSHIATQLNYRMAVLARSDFLAYNNFPEAYHGGETSKALISGAERAVAGERGEHDIQ